MQKLNPMKHTKRVEGCGIGYEHWHINMLADFITGIEKGEKTCPDLKDAVLASAKNKNGRQFKNREHKNRRAQKIEHRGQKTEIMSICQSDF